MLQTLLTALTLISCVSGENPAVQLVLTNKGLQYVRHIGAGWVQEKLDLITFPDISGKIGFIKYTLSGVRITQCDFPEPSVEFNPNNTGLTMSLSGLSVAVNGSWASRVGLISDGGTFDMAVFKVDVTSVLEFGKHPSGHLSVTSVSCGANIQSVDVRFYGGASWIFKPFVRFFKKYIRAGIQGNICPYLEESVAGLEQYLQAMNVTYDVNPAVSLELPLSVSPGVDSESMNFGLKGEFLSLETHKDPPFVARPFSLPKQSNYMLLMGLSEFTVNSASFAYYSAGHLQANINDSMIPPYFPFRLNTSSMGQYVPQLPKLFPGLLMTLQIYAGEMPLFSFEPDSVKLGMSAAIKAFAVQPNATLTPLFKLNVDSQFSGKVWIDNEKLKSSVMMDNFTLSLASSEVGPFKTDALEGLAKIGMKAVVKTINEKLGQGFDLPRMKGAQLVNSVLKVEKGFVALTSDAQLQSTY